MAEEIKLSNQSIPDNIGGKVREDGKCQLISFLDNHRVKKGEQYTHTGIGLYRGSYKIPEEKMEEFYDLYIKAMENNVLHLTEKTGEYFPILVDIDFKFPFGQIERKYTKTDIKTVVSHYFEEMKSVLELKGEHLAFILEKNCPTIKKGCCQDGFHVIFPFTYTNAETQLYLRKRVIEKICNFSHLPLINDMEDIFDRNVVHVNWTMYGSISKVNRRPYCLTSVMDENGEEKNIEEYSNGELVKTLSVSQMRKPIDVKEEFKNKCKRKEKKVFKKVDSRLENMDFIKELVGILSKERADDYDTWIRVGWCLFNLNPNLLDSWIEFSRKSDKYIDGVCEKIWLNSHNSEMTLGSLCYWAKTDNFKEYCKIKKKYKSLFNTSEWFGIEVYENMFKPNEKIIPKKKELFGMELLEKIKK
jgi:hypothetical protein